MESILPGSSEHLLRYTKSGSVQQTLPLSSQNSPTYNPYSIAEHDPDIGNGSPQSSLWQNLPSSTSIQPLNYMDPVPSLKPGETQSECKVQRSDSERALRGSHIAGASDRLSASADSRPSAGGSKVGSSGKGNSRQGGPTRSTISHMERGNGPPPVQLSRSNTERLATKSPDHNIYELDEENLTVQSKPPMPSKAPPVPKPRGRKAPPPRVKNLESHSDSQQSSSFVSSDETEPRYAASPGGQNFKEAEFEYPEPAPMGHLRPSSSQGVKPDKPPVTPRRKPFKQPEYLTLSTDAENSVNGLSRTEGSVGQGPSSLSEEMVRNFTPEQLDKLITMLQQVQSDGQQHQPIHLSPSEPQAAKTRDSMRKNFSESVTLTILLV